MAAILSSASMWFIIGVLLLAVEAVHTGILALFFAAGAWATAALMWLGIIRSTEAQLAVFLTVSVVSLLLLRSKMQRWMTGLRRPAGEDAALDDFAGNLATVVEDIEPGKTSGKVEFRGALWAARADKPIAKGEVVKIMARDNLTLSVQSNKEA